MSETVDYDDSIIMETFRSEVCHKLGEEAWNTLTAGIGTPDIEKEGKSGCCTMREFMQRFDALTDKAAAKAILTHVRHGLKRSQFASAKAKFAQCHSDIDEFIRVERTEQAQYFTRLRDTGESFYGQVVNDEVLAFVVSHPELLAAVRDGSDLYITGFPANMAEYIAETDVRRKRYHACHCPFAKASILAETQEVSPTLCYCSLGHAKIMWEAIFDRELDGEVVESVLAGDMRCKFVIHLPDEVVAQYT